MTDISDIVPGICWSHSSSLWVTLTSILMIPIVFTPNIILCYGPLIKTTTKRGRHAAGLKKFLEDFYNFTRSIFFTTPKQRTMTCENKYQGKCMDEVSMVDVVS